jgi:hypothetical protein
MPFIFCSKELPLLLNKQSPIKTKKGLFMIKFYFSALLLSIITLTITCSENATARENALKYLHSELGQMSTDRLTKLAEGVKTVKVLNKCEHPEKVAIILFNKQHDPSDLYSYELNKAQVIDPKKEH